MPKINRFQNQDYNYLVIHRGDKMITDITRPRNVSGYKWAIKKILAGEKTIKRPNKVVEFIKVNNLKFAELKFKVFDEFYGTYEDAVKHLEQINYKLGISNKYETDSIKKIRACIYPSGKTPINKNVIDSVNAYEENVNVDAIKNLIK